MNWIGLRVRHEKDRLQTWNLLLNIFHFGQDPIVCMGSCQRFHITYSISADYAADALAKDLRQNGFVISRTHSYIIIESAPPTLAFRQVRVDDEYPLLLTDWRYVFERSEYGDIEMRHAYQFALHLATPRERRLHGVDSPPLGMYRDGDFDQIARKYESLDGLAGNEASILLFGYAAIVLPHELA